MIRLTLSFGLLAAFAFIGAGNTDAATNDKRARAYEPRVVCGQTGCFEVPPGCRGATRYSGHGIVAVVTCGKK